MEPTFLTKFAYVDDLVIHVNDEKELSIHFKTFNVILKQRVLKLR